MEKVLPEAPADTLEPLAGEAKAPWMGVKIDLEKMLLPVEAPTGRVHLALLLLKVED